MLDPFHRERGQRPVRESNLPRVPGSHGQRTYRAVSHTKPPDSQAPASCRSLKMQKPEAGRVELAEVSSLAACRRIRSTVDSPALRQIQGPFSTALVLCVLRLALPVDTPQGFETPTSGMKTSPRSSHLGQGGQLVDHPLSCCCPYCPSSVKVQSGGGQGTPMGRSWWAPLQTIMTTVKVVS